MKTLTNAAKMIIWVAIWIVIDFGTGQAYGQWVENVSSNHLVSIAHTKDGGVVGINNTNREIVKYDVNGNYLWKKSALQSDNRFYTVEATDDGGFVVGGTSDYLSTSNSYSNIWKYSTDGDIEFEQQGGSSSNYYDRITKISVLNDSMFFCISDAYSDDKATYKDYNTLTYFGPSLGTDVKQYSETDLSDIQVVVKDVSYQHVTVVGKQGSSPFFLTLYADPSTNNFLDTANYVEGVRAGENVSVFMNSFEHGSYIGQNTNSENPYLINHYYVSTQSPGDTTFLFPNKTSASIIDAEKIDFWSNTFMLYEYEDMFNVARIDTFGNILWNVDLGNVRYEDFYDLTVGDSGVYISGIYYDYHSGIPSNPLIKIGLDGSYFGPTASYTDTMLCERHGSFMWHGTNGHTDERSVVIAEKNQYGGDSVMVLLTDSMPAYSFTVDTAIYKGDSVYIDSYGFVSVEGDYDVSHNTSFGCDSIITYRVSVTDTQSSINVFENCGIGSTILITTKQQLDSIGHCKNINGSLHILNEPNPFDGRIYDLDTIYGLESISGFFKIDCRWIDTIDGFNQLVVGDSLVITDNEDLVHIEGFNALSGLKKIDVNNNSDLYSINGFNNVTNLDSLRINKNNGLRSVSGFNQLDSVEVVQFMWQQYMNNIDFLSALNYAGRIKLKHNFFLRDITGLSNVTAMNDYIDISYCASLETLDGLQNINSVVDTVVIATNQELSTCCQAIPIIETATRLVISDNDPGCNSPEEVVDSCEVWNQLEAIYESIDTTICEGDIVLEHGKVYQDEGYHYDTIQTSGGHDSIYVTVFVDYYNNGGGLDTVYFHQGDSVLVGDYYAYQEGEYRDTITGSHGCDSMIYMQLIADSSLPSFFEVRYKCPEDSIYLYDEFITEAGLYVDTVDGGSFIDTVYTTRIYNYYTASFDTVYLSGAGIDYTAVDTFTSYNGCDSTNTTYYFYDSLPQDTILVWPGDLDNNGIVDMMDVLPLGFRYEAQGPTRDSISIVWTGHASTEWGNTFRGVDLTYADANGDGTLNILDAQAIIDNYSKTHSRSMGDEGRSFDHNMDLKFSKNRVDFGEEFDISIDLGEEGVDEMDAYALLFNLTSNVDVKMRVTDIDFKNSWLGTEDDDLLPIFHENKDDDRVHNSIDFGMTRVDRQHKLGGGNVAKVSLIIDEIIAGRRTDTADLQEVLFQIENVKVYDENDSTVSAGGSVDTILVGTVGVEELETLSNKVSVYPIPATNELTIAMNGINIENLEIRNMLGQMVEQRNPNATKTIMDVSRFTQGVYFAVIYTERGSVTKRFIVD